MPDTKISALATLTGVNVASGDLFSLVDISDTSMAGSGTDKGITAAEVARAMQLLVSSPGLLYLWTNFR